MLNRSTRIYFSPKFSLEKRPLQVRRRDRFSKQQRKIPSIANRIRDLYGQYNINFYNHLAEELVNEKIYESFDKALYDCQLVVKEVQAEKVIKEELKDLLNQRKRVNNWYREFFNLGWSLQKIKNKESSFLLVVVAPSIDLVSSVIAAGFTCSYFRSLPDSQPTDNKDKVDILKQLGKEESRQQHFLFRKTEDNIPVVVAYKGFETWTMFDAARRFIFGKYSFTRGLVKLYTFTEREDESNVIVLPEYEVHDKISLVPDDYSHRKLRPGMRFQKRPTGLVGNFLSSNQLKLFEKKHDKLLCRIYGITAYLQNDLCKTQFIFEDPHREEKLSGRLNDIVRADWLGQFQTRHSEIVSPRARKASYSKLRECDLVIFQGSDSYLKFSSMDSNKNCIAVLSPDELDFDAAIGKANNDYSTSSSDLVEESLASFADKYPCMGYWR